MATKSKNTNLLIKFVCILLSVICAATAAKFAVNIGDAVNAYNVSAEEFNGKPLNKKVSDSSRIYELMGEDIREMDTQMVARDTKTLKKALAQYRENYINTVYSNYIYDKNEFVFDDDYGMDNLFRNAYTINYKDVYFVITIGDKENITFDTDTEEVAKGKIEKAFDDFINSENYTEYLEYEDREITDSRLYVTDKNTGAHYGTYDGILTDEDVMSHEYGFIVKGGVLTCTEGFSGLFKDMIDEKTGKCTAFNENYDYYMYVDSTDDTYAGYNAAISNAERAADINPLRSAVNCGTFTLLALIFAIISFVLCGNKDKNGKVKLAFIDRVPTDLHIAITIGLQIGLGAIFVYAYDTIINHVYPFERYLYYALYASFAVAWALLIECVTSFIRVCGSEKKLYKNTLFYLICKYLIVKPWGFIFRKAKAFFSYKPENFNKVIRRFLIGYGALNAFFILVLLICIGDESFFGYFFCFVSIAVNIVLLVYIVKYLKDLDTIITAAHFRQPPRVDYNKLPNSLKTLVNSLNYTSAELKSAVDKAVRDERMRTELITNVSHDLKTPLTSIINYVDLLKGCDIQDETAQEYIGVLDEKGTSLKRLIDDLIEASKITSGVININPININLSELATQAIVEHQQEFAENGLSLVFKGDQKNISAFADGTKTFRIMENLISNARKYSLRGTRVYADVYETQNFSIFEIKNTSSEPLDIPVSELTERFVRGDKSRTNEGSGLGLSIADNLCKAQGGHLNITIDGDLFKAQVMLPKAR